MKKFGLIAALSLVLPLSASAAITDLDSIFVFIKNLLNTLLPLIIAAAVVYFVYGIAKYVMAGDDDAKAAAKDKIVYGIIGLFVMVSVWGLVNILVNTFGISETGPVGNIDSALPEIDTDVTP
jgi:hypothetical protein